MVVLCTISQARLARWMQRFDLFFARKQNAHDAIYQHKCSKKQGKVAVFQAGFVMEIIDCYCTVITISIELGMVKAEQRLDS